MKTNKQEQREPVSPKGEHTPTPWRVEDEQLYGADNFCVNVFDIADQPIDAANAAFIVRAVNFMGELDRLKYHVANAQEHIDSKDYAKARRYLDVVMELIAKAEGSANASRGGR